MKQSPTDRMKDPFYAGLLFLIEQMICRADDVAASTGLELTDSQVRSAIIKAQKKVRGDEPAIPERNERERILAALIEDVYRAPDTLIERVTADDGMGEKQPLEKSDWVNALETVQDSIKTRKSDLAGSRNYLNFLHGFIAQAKGTKSIGKKAPSPYFSPATGSETGEA